MNTNGNEKRPLPDGWTNTTVNDVFVEIRNGVTGRQNKDEVGFPVTRIQTISNGIIDLAKVGFLDNIEQEKLQKYRLINGDILFSNINSDYHLGKTALFELGMTELYHGMNLLLIRLNREVIMPRYLHYLFNYYRQNGYFISIAQHAVNQSSINQTKLKNVEIPLAPLPEQERIVAEIEKQFTRLDQAVVSLRRLQSNLARYKASVLKAACNGSLVPQDPNDEPADHLLTRILAERRAQWQAANPGKKYKEPVGVEEDTAVLPDLPDGWVWTTIDQVSECLDSMRVPVNKKEREKRQGSIPYYGANGPVGWIDDYLFNEPLVLVVEDETFTGREKPFTYKITGKTWVNNHAHVLRATATTTDYLNYSLMFYPFTPLTTGTTGRRKLTQRALRAASYALPPLAEQERIVAEVERRLYVVTAVEQTITANLSRAERLRQSILHRAFTGQLVPQEEVAAHAG